METAAFSGIKRLTLVVNSSFDGLGLDVLQCRAGYSDSGPVKQGPRISLTQLGTAT